MIRNLFQRKLSLVTGVFSAAVLLTAATPLVASAHILRTDGNMSAELHLPPDDTPIAGTPTAYQLTFTDPSEDFSLANCDCSVAFLKDGTTVGEQTLSGSSATVATGSYMFKDPASYVFHVTGAPKNGATFKPFTLEYTERVGGKASDNGLSPIVLAAIGVGAGLIILYAIIRVIQIIARQRDGSA